MISTIASHDCETCGHLTAMPECIHARPRATRQALDLAIGITALSLATAVAVALPHGWLGAWAYFVAVALAAWTPGWLVAPIAVAGIAVPLAGAPFELASLGASAAQAGILGLAIVVIRRARRQRDELILRRAA